MKGGWSKLAWQQSLRGQPLSPTQYMVLLTIGTYADGNGRHAHPSLATLANDTGLNPKTIKAAVRNLVEHGYLILTSAGGNQFGKGMANEYRLSSAADWSPAGEDQPDVVEAPAEPPARGPADAPLAAPEGGQQMVPFESGRGPNDDREGAQMTTGKGPNRWAPIRSLSGPRSGPKNVPGPVVPVRDDVQKLCEDLRDRIVANGSRAPAITKDWLDQARLLIDRDERPLEEAHRLIAWCQQDAFWRSNILSMAKFRTQYDKLRLQSNRPRDNQARPGTLTNQQWQQAMVRAQHRMGG